MRLAALLVCAGLAVGCSGDDGPDVFTVEFSPVLQDYQGYYFLKGTVTFPQDVPAGARAIVGLSRERPTTFAVTDVSSFAFAPRPSNQLIYRVNNLAGGMYTVFAGVDLNGDGVIGTGDLAGYFDGTSNLPTQQPAAAATFRMRSETMINFGIGPVPPSL